MSDLTAKQKGDIKKKLLEAGAKLPCPRCNNKSFSILDGYLNPSLYKTKDGELTRTKYTVPTAVLICDKCSYMSYHALGSMGLMPGKDTEEEGS